MKTKEVKVCGDKLLYGTCWVYRNLYKEIIC